MEEDIFSVPLDSPIVEHSSLPSSSTDLAVPTSALLPLISVYQILLDKFQLGHLAFEEFCAAVAYKDSCSVVNDVHIALLDTLIAKVRVTLKISGN